ncbi:MAG: inositol monophosphatase family protein [Chloroflexaceae bacterium]|nr:inositol monophosphatase family protein [Chloroflexaceae bacterium]
MTNGLPEMLDFGHQIAWQAGKIALRYFQTDIHTDYKTDESPVTIADREAEHYLRTVINQRYPDHAILGEEEGATGDDNAPWRWILDPIDGTRAFVRGMPIFGVMIGIEYEHDMVAGIVYLPALGEMVYAARGLGCRWNGRPCQVSNVTTLDKSLMVATRITRYDEIGRQQAFERLVNRAALFRTWGDCYGYVLVATGRAELMVDPAMHIWDAAPMLPILEEAGGTFTDWNGDRSVTAGNGIATNGLIYDEIFELL